MDNTSDNAVKNKVITRFLNEINAKLLEIIENFDNYYDKDEVDIFQNKFSVIKIITGSDLNTYTSCGFYSFDSGNLINCPTQTSFFMITGLSNNSPYQIIYDFNNDIYIRQKYSNSIENIWQDWRCVTNPIVIDDALNTVSLNPVENRVITERLNEILSIIDTTGYTIQEICDYFTSEKIIGTWVDGKTLYQKAIHIPTMPNSTTLVIDADVEDLYEIIDFRGYCRPKDKDIQTVEVLVEQLANMLLTEALKQNYIGNAKLISVSGKSGLFIDSSVANGIEFLLLSPTNDIFSLSISIP